MQTSTTPIATPAKLVLIVHAIDTEGPLYESPDATFERLKDLFGITNLEATQETLNQLKVQGIDLGGLEPQVAEILSGHAADYMDSWEKLEAMLYRVTSLEFRNSMPDSFGGGWVYSWHYLDHVGFIDNPRRRDLGFHKVFDRYQKILSPTSLAIDGEGWHFHPVSTKREAHRCATSYLRSPEFFEILSRKILERDWFPVVFRAGFQAERPDSHWLLEQWIPFDITNMALPPDRQESLARDLTGGRSADWRRAPHDWSVYHPSHDDYQMPGNCRRSIARALNVLARLGNLNQVEVDRAFARADCGLPTIMGIASHDFRDLGREVEFVRNLIQVSKERYPQVKFKFCSALTAFREALWPGASLTPALDFELRFNPASDADVASLDITTTSGQVFGPQPFLAIQTVDGRVFQDNLDFGMVSGEWSYAFHADTIPLEQVAQIGVAANDQYGNSCVKKINFCDLKNLKIGSDGSRK